MEEFGEGIEERKRDRFKRFLTHKIKPSDLEVGDHIYTWRGGFIYSHHGIYVGEDKVVHFSSRSLKSLPNSKCTICGTEGESGVIASCLKCFLGKGSLYRYKYKARRREYFTQIRGGTSTTATSDDPKTVIHRALYLHNNNGFGKYNLISNNCEDFAFYCKTGKIVPPDSGVGCSGQIGAVIGEFRKDPEKVEVENLAEFLGINTFRD